MDFGLVGKVAAVLGGSRGLGRACAASLAREGCSLALAGRDGAPLRAEAAGLAELHRVPVFCRPCDVTRDDDREEFLREAVVRFGQVDILINNCGGPKPGGLKDVQLPGDWRDALDRSFLQVVNWTQAVVPLMRGWGRIVNIVSTSVKQSIDGLLLSNTTRPGVIGFSKSASRELARRGITINSILPGRFRTDRTDALARTRADREHVPLEAVLQERLQGIPAGRLGDPEELGALVAFLCSRQAAYITGTTVTIDGGMTRALL